MPGKTTVTVVMRFTVEASVPVNCERISSWFRQKIEAAGIPDPYSIRIEEVQR